MSLSNIFNEPRREIIETIVGLATVAVPLALFSGADYYLSNLDHSACSFGLKLLFYGFALAVCLGFLTGASVFIHAVGENMCAVLQAHGINLRPTKRH